MDTKTLKAEKRLITGRKIKKLRKQGLLPGNIYGKKVKSQSVQVSLSDFEKVYKEAGETGLVSLELEKEKEKRPVLVHNLQLNPVTDKPVHVDFLQVDLKEKVTAKVAVELIGESPAEKQGLGTVVQQLNEIEVEALPSDLPEKFEIDKSILTEVDQAIKVSDIKVDRSKVEIKIDAESIIVKVEPPQKEEVIEAPVVPVGSEGAVPAEGEAPAPASTEAAAGKEAPKEEGSSDQSA
ncbi:MAG: 50S ribosomal protein L25 [Patescibacteria group bacterium]